jgi:tripartite-type tricarboxylate transporter receptor subunit TctC
MMVKTMQRWRARCAAGLFTMLALLLGVMATGASAQAPASYPTKPIRFILPFPPGGGTDIIGRLLAQKLSEELGQSVVTENRPGAGGNIGVEVAAKSPPDGYTIVICTVSLAVSPTLYRGKLNYDPLRDLAPIGLVAQQPQVIAVHPSMPARSVKEMLHLARTHPGRVSFGTGGSGTTNDLVAQIFKSISAADVLIVPYKGIAPATVAILSGEVDAAVIGVATAVPYVKAGKLRAIATLAPKRVASLPDVPTAAEAGYPQLEAVLWYAIMAPAGTPQPAIARLSQAFSRITASPDTRERLASVGAEPMTSSPEEFAAFLKKEIARWGKAVEAAGAKAQ